MNLNLNLFWVRRTTQDAYEANVFAHLRGNPLTESKAKLFSPRHSMIFKDSATAI